MEQPLRKGISMESSGYLGNSRVVLNHFDAATQADIQHTALSYESEDEAMGRSRRNLYSKQDIREQYCISERGLGALEDQTGFFGCLSTHHPSPCTTRSNILTVCVRRKVPSDENLHELYRRQQQQADYAPMPRYPWGPPPPDIYRYDEELECSYFRRRPRADPTRYTWMPADEEHTRLERPRSVLDTCPAHPGLPPPPPPILRPKHVSFARSHTLTSFDDAVVSLSSSQASSRMTRSQERLLDGRKSAEPPPITRQPEPSESVMLIEKLKRTPMKTQATQTEACLGRKPLPPSQLNLSPRTIHRVKMVSQGAQTNGILVNGRKLMKSYSEAGGRFGPHTPPHTQTTFAPECMVAMQTTSVPGPIMMEPMVGVPMGVPMRIPMGAPMVDHEPLQRSQSEEPPRSPFVPTSPPPTPHQPQSDSSSLAQESDESSKYQREIFIDFEPQLPMMSPMKKQKKVLLKTVSDGEMLLDHRKLDLLLTDKPLTSFSTDNIAMHEPDSSGESRSFTPYFQNSPIRHEDIFRDLDDLPPFVLSTGMRPQDSLDEEFHENLIYRGMFRKRSASSSDPDQLESEPAQRKSAGPSPDDESIVPSLYLMPDQKISPFASTDSLANDLTRDHSDGIWNESQATVLQADSGTDNGKGLSTSDITSSLAPVASPCLLTPSSRRKHLLLLQHQQRSSMDTEALEEEVQMVEHTTSIQMPQQHQHLYQQQQMAQKHQQQYQPQPQEQKVQSPSSPRVIIEPPPKIALHHPAPDATAPVPTSISTASSSIGGVKHHQQQQQQIMVTPRPRLTLSPARRRRPSEPLAPSPQPAVVPDLLLARTDSGKTNTDVSESTTTDDYITANSGTDSSKKSGSQKHDKSAGQSTNQDGSSFESNASSMYSVAKVDFLLEDMVVPSYSPPPIPEELSDVPSTPVPPSRAGRSSPSGSSSSSGSYSLDAASLPELPPIPQHRPPVPSPPARHAPPSVSDDERSAHYSSSGYYESPAEDDSTWKSPRSGRRPQQQTHQEWTEDDKKIKKRAFTLDIIKQQQLQHQQQLNQGQEDQPQTSTSHPSHHHHHLQQQPPPPQKKSPIEKAPTLHQMQQQQPSERSRKEEVIAQAVVSPSQEHLKPMVVEKATKRVKTRTRSPMQMHRRNHHMKKSPTSARSPDSLQVDDAWDRGDMEADLGVSSDESSADPTTQSQSSPRKNARKMRDIRRKSSPRSPTGTRTRRKSDDLKPSSLPGTLARRRSSMQPKVGDNDPDQSSKSSRLSPYSSRSPGASPVKKSKTTGKISSAAAGGGAGSPETRLKALSAESLRSVSPGSDSVFYSDPSSHAAPPEHQVHCLHCGKEVDIVTTDDPDKSAGSSNGIQPDIVQPPAGFADSPRAKHQSGGRLYKKLEKRFRSEERHAGEKKHHKYRSDVRAKSEERAGAPENVKAKLRPMARSTDTSLEGLKATDSSPSVLAGAPDDDDDLGLYSAPYNVSCWAYIGNREEMQAWQKSESIADESETRRESTGSVESTESEHEFRKRYQAVTHRMVHRKSCLEMYKRQSSKSFECDKTVIVRRESGEFGFRIHGSKPVVVSAIEPDTPAESSGLEVGDIVLSVNGVSVLDKSHSEVVKIAHAGSDTLTLEVARTCGVMSPVTAETHGGSTLFSGYIWKQGGHVSGTPTNKWIRRWFCLKKDNCLYYYKTDADNQPVGAMMLVNYEILRCEDGEPGAPPRPFRIVLKKPGVPTLHLAADTEQAASRWHAILAHAAEKSQLADTWLEQTRRNLMLPPSSLQRPDCFGYLVKLGSQWKSWSRRYCVLKDACLYFYQDANSKNAFGVACLHGYRVQQSITGGKKHAFEILPADSSQKHFYFHTESEMDRKRWLAALEYSIDRWLKVG